jgi:large subunit ribosomal protein L18
MNDHQTLKRQKRLRRHARVRSRIAGTDSRPRLTVFRSANHIYAQLIDDVTGKTLAAASSSKLKGLKKSDKSVTVGKEIAQAAQGLKIDTVVFDRGGYKYIGRVKALADAAREAGLKF